MDGWNCPKIAISTHLTFSRASGDIGFIGLFCLIKTQKCFMQHDSKQRKLTKPLIWELENSKYLTFYVQNSNMQLMVILLIYDFCCSFNLINGDDFLTTICIIATRAVHYGYADCDMSHN